MVFQKIHFTDFFERKWGWPHDFRIRACIDFQSESQHFSMNARARFCARWPRFRTGSGAARTAEDSRSLPSNREHGLRSAVTFVFLCGCNLCRPACIFTVFQIHKHTGMHTDIHTPVYTPIYTHRYTHRYIHTPVYTPIYTHQYTHRCIHTGIHTDI